MLTLVCIVSLAVPMLFSAVARPKPQPVIVRSKRNTRGSSRAI
jgi:hypothetical protein